MLCYNNGEDKMTEIKGILLIPEEGDPHGLLKEGPCGARPPMAFVWKPSYLRLPQPEGRWIPWSTTWPKPGEALVLAWDGEAVRDPFDGSLMVVDASRRRMPAAAESAAAAAATAAAMR